MATTNRHDMSRDYARLMLIMRRMVREEFSVTVHLDEPAAGEELLVFADRSDNPMLKEMAVELEPMLREDGNTPPPAEQPQEPAQNVPCYRGAPVRREQPSEATAAPKNSARIYRGRRVEK